jgi:hypothetical protein
MIFQDEESGATGRHTLHGFKVVYVFDVSQTDGEPVPPAPEWKSPQQNAALAARLIAYSESLKISVTVKALAGETQGVSMGGSIALDPKAGTKTLIHEIAHEMMHRGTDRPVDGTIRELEAESVAYVVGRYFGLDDLASPNYVALHGVTSDLIMKHLERISHTSSQIITALTEKASEAGDSSLVGK